MDMSVNEIMDQFDKMAHNDQVEFFNSIRDGLLILRKSRIEAYRKTAQDAEENIGALLEGNGKIAGATVER